MCINCFYDQGYTEPVINETTKRAAELIQTIYNTEDGGAGGYAHIVVDDWNLDDSSIDYCLEACAEAKCGLVEETRQACIELLNFMKPMSEHERYSAMFIKRKY